MLTGTVVPVLTPNPHESNQIAQNKIPVIVATSKQREGGSMAKYGKYVRQATDLIFSYQEFLSSRTSIRSTQLQRHSPHSHHSRKKPMFSTRWNECEDASISIELLCVCVCSCIGSFPQCLLLGDVFSLDCKRAFRVIRASDQPATCLFHPRFHGREILRALLSSLSPHSFTRVTYGNQCSLTWLCVLLCSTFCRVTSRRLDLRLEITSTHSTGSHTLNNTTNMVSGVEYSIIA